MFKVSLARFCILLFLFGSTCVYAENQSQPLKDDHTSGELYLPLENQMKAVDDLLATAKRSEKLALIIMGANWCHDSKALAGRLFLPEVVAGIEPDYERLFIDVGYFTNIKPVIQRFGIPIIYATPTVLVIEPNSEKVINKHNMHIWRDAAKINAKDTVAYFAELAKRKNKQNANVLSSSDVKTKQFAQLNLQISTFEKRQSKRLYAAYSIVGPLLKDYKENGSKEKFRKKWDLVAGFRYKLTDDLSKLRIRAKEIVASNDTGAILEFPEYLQFEWEATEK